MASQLFILGVILMSVQQIYSQEDLIELPKAVHEDFDREWYSETQKWVIENYEKDSIERNLKLVAFTNGLETTFKDKLRNITNSSTMTPEEFSEMHKNGTFVDDQKLTEVLEFGSILQQVYVKKIVELYELEPDFLNTTAQVFCEVFKACQYLTTLPPTITTTIPDPTTTLTTTITTIKSTTTIPSTSTEAIESTEAVNEVTEKSEIEVETTIASIVSGTENFINDRAVVQNRSDENFDPNNLENDNVANITTITTLKPIMNMTEEKNSSSATVKPENVTLENVVTDKPEVATIETVGNVPINDDQDENVEDANPEHVEHTDAAASSQSEGSGASYVHLNLMVFAIVIGACFL